MRKLIAADKTGEAINKLLDIAPGISSDYVNSVTLISGEYTRLMNDRAVTLPQEFKIAMNQVNRSFSI